MSDKLSLAIKKYAIAKIKATPRKLLKIRESLAGGAVPVELPFNMQHQLYSQWCWAATSASVSVFYNAASAWTQCTVASSAFSLGCCQSPEPCNKSWYLNEALAITGNFVSFRGPMSYSEVEQELKAGKVIGCRIGWRDNGGHFMILYGCKLVAGVTYFDIDDPIYGKTELTASAFSTAYQGSGTWTHSFITKP